jgi:hypothetical protein
MRRERRESDLWNACDVWGVVKLTRQGVLGGSYARGSIVPAMA